MKKKIKIQDLQVQSFVTRLEDSLSNTAKGGTFGTEGGGDTIFGPPGRFARICTNTVNPDNQSICLPECQTNWPPELC